MLVCTGTSEGPAFPCVSSHCYARERATWSYERYVWCTSHLLSATACLVTDLVFYITYSYIRILDAVHIIDMGYTQI